MTEVPVECGRSEKPLLEQKEDGEPMAAVLVSVRAQESSQAQEHQLLQGLLYRMLLSSEGVAA